MSPLQQKRETYLRFRVALMASVSHRRVRKKEKGNVGPAREAAGHKLEMNRRLACSGCFMLPLLGLDSSDQRRAVKQMNNRRQLLAFPSSRQASIWKADFICSDQWTLCCADFVKPEQSFCKRAPGSLFVSKRDRLFLKRQGGRPSDPQCYPVSLVLSLFHTPFCHPLCGHRLALVLRNTVITDINTNGVSYQSWTSIYRRQL